MKSMLDSEVLLYRIKECLLLLPLFMLPIVNGTAQAGDTYRSLDTPFVEQYTYRFRSQDGGLINDLGDFVLVERLPSEQDAEGNWIPQTNIIFGNVIEGVSSTDTIRLSGYVRLFAYNNNGELYGVLSSEYGNGTGDRSSMFYWSAETGLKYILEDFHRVDRRGYYSSGSFTDSGYFVGGFSYFDFETYLPQPSQPFAFKNGEMIDLQEIKAFGESEGLDSLWIAAVSESGEFALAGTRHKDNAGFFELPFYLPDADGEYIEVMENISVDSHLVNAQAVDDGGWIVDLMETTSLHDYIPKAPREWRYFSLDPISGITSSVIGENIGQNLESPRQTAILTDQGRLIFAPQGYVSYNPSIYNVKDLLSGLDGQQLTDVILPSINALNIFTVSASGRYIVGSDPDGNDELLFLQQESGGDYLPEVHTGDGRSASLDCDNPGIDLDSDSGFYFWKSCSGTVHAMLTSAEGAGSVSGVAFTTTSGQRNLESSDLYSVQDESLTFNLSTGPGWSDELYFRDPANTCVKITSSSVPIYYGQYFQEINESSFNLETLAPCETSDPPSTVQCGDPDVSPSVDAGVFIWQNCGTNEWNLMLTGTTVDKSTSQVVGAIGATESVSNLNAVSIESRDTLTTMADGLVKFDVMTANPWDDRFSFTAGGDVCIVLDSTTTGINVMLGGNRVQLANDAAPFGFNPANGESCSLPKTESCVSATINRSEDRGFFVWQESGCSTGKEQTFEVALVGNNDGSVVRSVGYLESSLGFSDITALSLEESDTLGSSLGAATENRFDIRTITPWDDRLRFSVPASSDVCITLESGNVAAYSGATRIPVGDLSQGANVRFDPVTGGPCN